MADILVVGALGVGQAHSLAGLKLGHNVCAYDINPDILKIKHTYLVENKWGHIHDRINLNKDMSCKYGGTFTPVNNKSEIEDKNFDLTIIATPTETHKDVIKNYVNKGLILCEKPYCIDPKDFVNFYYPNVYCGLDWTFLTEDPLSVLNTSNCSIIHPYQPSPDTDPLFDLGVHLLSLFDDLGKPSDWSIHREQSEKLDVVYINNKISGLLIECGYNTDKTKEQTFINGKEVEWIPFDHPDGDLFTRQIDYLIKNNKHKVSHKSVKTIHDILFHLSSLSRHVTRF